MSVIWQITNTGERSGSDFLSSISQELLTADPISLPAIIPITGFERHPTLWFVTYIWISNYSSNYKSRYLIELDCTLEVCEFKFQNFLEDVTYYCTSNSRCYDSEDMQSDNSLRNHTFNSITNNPIIEFTLHPTIFNLMNSRNSRIFSYRQAYGPW